MKKFLIIAAAVVALGAAAQNLQLQPTPYLWGGISAGVLDQNGRILMDETNRVIIPEFYQPLSGLTDESGKVISDEPARWLQPN